MKRFHRSTHRRRRRLWQSGWTYVYVLRRESRLGERQPWRRRRRLRSGRARVRSSLNPFLPSRWKPHITKGLLERIVVELLWKREDWILFPLWREGRLDCQRENSVLDSTTTTPPVTNSFSYYRVTHCATLSRLGEEDASGWRRQRRRWRKSFSWW